jgi:GTP diphosphokinase / guanosine-3',5'-bis(diphosphate) 3'-diphosphatase
VSETETLQTLLLMSLQTSGIELYNLADVEPIEAAFQDLLRCFKGTLSDEDRTLLHSAYEIALSAHSSQRRKSGEPYILHPIAVAKICVVEIGLGPTAIACALLHDVVEDTEVTLDDIKQQFGDKIAIIVDGLTKLDSLHEQENAHASNLQKVLRAMLIDMRVVLIKMADRVHNLRTIKSMPAHKQLKIAAETSFIYAPLAHRLGLNSIKTEFQDLCLKIQHPREYKEIADKLNETKVARNQYIDAFLKPLKEGLRDLGVPYRVLGRPKSIHSIFQKINEKKVAFEDIYDLFAFRIILDVPRENERRSCWDAYMLVSDIWQPIPERLKDWITHPKANGYESLHTSVIGPNGRYVEVQIRSERMDEIAERGFAAHWKYKGIANMGPRADVFENWLNQVRESIEHTSSAVQFLDDFQSNLFQNEIHVFTPSGELRIMAEGSTALDFAFSIHSDVGCECQAVKINNRIAPISTKLRSGDQIEIIRSKNQKPTEDWLKLVNSSKAKNRIRAALREDKKKVADFGIGTLMRKLSQIKASFEENVDMLAKHYDYPNRLEFLYAIGLEQISLTGIKDFKQEGHKLIAPERNVSPAEALKTGKRAAAQKKEPQPHSQVLINGEPGAYYSYQMATCCNPVQGDDIFAYIAIEGMKIHRSACSNAQYLMASQPFRCMKAEWGNAVKADFLAQIEIIGKDGGVGVISNITNTISNILNINMRSFSISSKDGYFTCEVQLVVSNNIQLGRAIIQLKGLPDVTSVQRVIE